MQGSFDLNGSMKPYLTGSAAAHVALLAGLGFFAGGGGKAPPQVYRIDFIGTTGTIINREKAGAPKPASKPKAAKPAAARSRPALQKPEAQKDPDAFGVKASLKPLPRPSFLPAADPKAVPKAAPPAIEETAPEPSQAAEDASAASEAGSGADGGGAGGSGAVVTADMSDFPYPWYLARLRSSLWDRWQERMPQEVMELGVVFSVMRDGRIVDLRIEFTSGDSAYDYAALSAVRAAAPLPPLPPGFPERFLRVHVQFQAK